MKTGALWLLAALAAGCGKKNIDAAPVADAAAKDAPTSCLHAQNARAYAWRPDALELVLDVELDWTCKELAEDKLELTDTDIGAKLGEQRPKERYRVDKAGAVAEWHDPFLVDGKPRLHGLFVYSVPTVPTTVGLRYGGVQILPSIPVVAPEQKPPRKSSMRIVATSSEPGKEKGTNRVTALLELVDVPRSAGRLWKVPGTYVPRTFYVEMTGEAHDGVLDGERLDADRVLDVDERLVPTETPASSLPVRPAKRFVLAEVSATKMKKVSVVGLTTSEIRLLVHAEGAGKLVVPKETRARLDAAPPSADPETPSAR